ncbi:ABC transporter ATP-binding protein [Denitratisoma sp. DHT3]|uniref:ABC transporter permease subunit n=1 Tax=Denitratisoma sp. DHT3 TaxID=1981880 RepID=UPI00119851DA|nr:ABC transporter ATP-binding protein [Denitratisoma sp. DHT3]QDX81897.1 ABC transporter ATP-binding protein [Denitratisoma sp. DHT3]
MTSRQQATLAAAGIAAVLAVLPFLVGAGFGPAWVRVLDFVLLYILLALGLNIVVGFAGLLDLGYVAFYAVGAYLYALLNSPHLAEHFPALAAQFPGGLHFPIWLVLPAGAVLAGVFGVVLGFPTLRLRGDYLAIVTLGFGEIIRIFLNNLYAPVNITNGALGLTQIDGVRLGSVALDRSQQILGFTVPSLHLYYYLFLFLALVVVLISIRLEDSRIGRAWVAIREDEIAAKACGINTRNVKLLAFAMGASFGGLAGGLFAGFQQFVSPESFQLIDSIMILCMVVLGGMGHIPGVIFGALLLTVLPELFRYGAGPLQKLLFGAVMVEPEALRMLLFGLTLVLVMLFRPAGLWPDPRHRQEMGGRR